MRDFSWNSNVRWFSFNHDIFFHFAFSFFFPITSIEYFLGTQNSDKKANSELSRNPLSIGETSIKTIYTDCCLCDKEVSRGIQNNSGGVFYNYHVVFTVLFVFYITVWPVNIKIFLSRKEGKQAMLE